MKANKIKSDIKASGVNFLYRSNILPYYLKKVSNNSAIILSYHRVNTREYIKRNKVKMPMYVSVETFSMHLKWLLSNYKMVKLSQVIDKIQNQERWDEPLCAVTFDDGWYDNYEYAFPVMKTFNVPSTIFIVGNSVGTNEPNCWDICFELIHNINNLPKNLTGVSELDILINSDRYNRSEKARKLVNYIRKQPAYIYDFVQDRLREYYEKMLNTDEINAKYRTISWKEMREMQQFNVEFGYHSKSHYMMTQLPENRIKDEIMIPDTAAKQHGVKIKRIFCYPDGKFNDQIISNLKEEGYQGATTLKAGFNTIKTNPYELHRFMVHEKSSATLPHFLYNFIVF